MDQPLAHAAVRQSGVRRRATLFELRGNGTDRSETDHENENNQVQRQVFVDLGFDPAEATVLLMRADLMSDLRLYIEKHKLTQSDAAKRLGIAQSRVSDLVPGKWDKFSLEMLITLEARIGRTVRVEFAA
jgi:predicted XRE-type DNA-binding protein